MTLTVFVEERHTRGRCDERRLEVHTDEQRRNFREMYVLRTEIS